MAQQQFYKICDIEPCGIAGRNYPFPIQPDATDDYVGIGGGLSYSFKHCGDEGYCTKNEYFTIQDTLTLSNDPNDADKNKNNQYLAFNTLYTYTVMDILQIENIYRPGYGHDSWPFGLASSNIHDGGSEFIKLFEWSSTKLQLHVFPSMIKDEIAVRLMNINDETIGNYFKKYIWGSEENDATVGFIQQKIFDLNENFNSSIKAFRDLVEGVLAGTALEPDILGYCSQIDGADGLSPKDCADLIKENGRLIQCSYHDMKSEIHKDCENIDLASLYASGGLRNHVKESLDILTEVADGLHLISDEENGILSGYKEAFYGFLAVNVDHPSREDLKNVFDFGGQSIQLTKVIEEDDLPAYSNDRYMEVDGKDVNFYALSVNNFGSVAAAEWISEYWARKNMDNACLLTADHDGVVDKDKCIASLRLMLEPVSFYEDNCEERNSS